VVTQESIGSIAAMADTEPGTVVLQVSQQAVEKAADFRPTVKENIGATLLAALLPFEPMARELQRPAVLGHCSHNMV
jgi:hypothetical protein